MSVVSHAIRFLSQHLIHRLKTESGVTLSSSNIRWVLTVPAIWNDKAKQFMREAAYMVNIFCKELVTNKAEI